jgi:hypothetical protein
VLNVRRLFVALAVAVSQVAFAQDPAPRGELGLRYWLSTGENKHSHNAQGLFPTFGNPTSVLTYENLDANVLELYGRLNFAQNWFIKGNLGYGRINTGSFDDEDYLAGQVKFSDTTSSVPEGWLAYGTFDIGRNEWVLRQGRTTLGAFIGYNEWTEHVDAYGATDTLGGGGDISPGVKVISNKLIWRSLRVGLAADLALATRTRLGIDLAFIPYARVRNEDSHHLRTDPSDLGPVPNIIIEGNGRGVQFDAELRHAVYRRTELGVGFRYWYLKATDGKRQVVDFPDLPLVELYSIRTGLTLSVTHTW